ncbi:hypothetical protein ACSQ67_011657 [Phaseolus vulgaris]
MHNSCKCKRSEVTQTFMLVEATCIEVTPTFMIVEDEYKNNEEIEILQCGHEYHADCLRRWLQEKNVCPLCKSKAIAIG